jgi:fumarate reductase subunit D
MQWKHHEPLFWGLFAAGGVISAFTLPAVILLAGIAYPLGLLPNTVFSYQNMLELGQSWLGMLAILIVCSLTLWHCAHRIFHGLHDLGFETGTLARTLTYGVAGFVSAGLLVLLLTL